MGGLSGGIWLRQVSERLFRMQGRPGGGWVVHKGSYGMAPRAGGRGRPRRTRITARSSLAAAAQNPEPPRGGGPQSRRRPPNHAATASPTVDTGEAPRHRLRISQHPGRPPTRAPHSSLSSLSSRRGRPTRRSLRMPARRNSARATASDTIARNSAGEPPAIVKKMKSCGVSWQHQQNIDRSSAVRARQETRDSGLLSTARCCGHRRCRRRG